MERSKTLLFAAFGIFILLFLGFLLIRPRMMTEPVVTIPDAAEIVQDESTQDTPTPFTARIRTTEGTVLVLRDTTVTHVSAGFHLQSGDIVQTGPTSTADILWPMYGHTALGNESILVISQSNTEENRLSVKLYVEAGRVWARIQQILGADDMFGIETSNVASVVRGTSFGIHRLPNSVNIRVTEGLVSVFRSTNIGSFVPVGTEILVSANQETTAPIGVGSETRPIPQARDITPDYSRDAVFQIGDTVLSESELNDLEGPGWSSSRTPETIEAILYQSRLVALSELVIFTDREAACAGPHYHATTDSVMTMDGTVIQDPGGCGFGLIDETTVVSYDVR